MSVCLYERMAFFKNHGWMAQFPFFLRKHTSLHSVIYLLCQMNLGWTTLYELVVSCRKRSLPFSFYFLCGLVWLYNTILLGILLYKSGLVYYSCWERKWMRRRERRGELSHSFYLLFFTTSSSHPKKKKKHKGVYVHMHGAINMLICYVRKEEDEDKGIGVRGGCKQCWCWRPVCTTDNFGAVLYPSLFYLLPAGYSLTHSRVHIRVTRQGRRRSTL